MKLTKQSWQIFASGSAHQVVAHAEWRKSRGKSPSMAYRGIRNPTMALERAQEHLQRVRRLLSRPMYIHTFKGGYLDPSDRRVRGFIA